MGVNIGIFQILSWHKDDILHKEQAQQTTLLRSKRSLKPSLFYNLAGLRQEYKIGIIATASVNGLLFIINCIDVSFIWFNFDYGKAGNLPRMVHEGTYLLILSI